MTDQQTTTPTSDDFAAAWRPEPGQSVAGVVTEVNAVDLGYGLYPILTLRTDTGEIGVHAFHTVLRQSLARKRPKPGDELKITYLGKKENSSGRGDYHNYRVTGGSESGYDWNRDLPEEERAEAQAGTADPPIQPSTPPPASEPQPAAAAAGAQFGGEPPF